MNRVLSIAVSLMLCAAVALSCAMSAGAALAPLRIGDADSDNDITINDATKIQRYLADLETSPEWFTDELYRAVCDADGDGEATILDATAIQRKLADLPNSFVTGDYGDCYIGDYYIGDSAHHSTAELASQRFGQSRSEIAYVGVPVTFTAQVNWGAKPKRAMLTVGGEVVEEREVSGYDRLSFIYTFDTEGEHEAVTQVVCSYGVTAECRHQVTVKALPDDGRPVIMGAAFFDRSRMDSGDGVLTVTAAGGTAPYEYNYTFYTDRRVDTEYIDGVPQPGSDAFSTGYIARDTVSILDDYRSSEISGGPYYMTPDVWVKITVRDAEGRESDPVTVSWEFYQLVA